MSTNTLSIFLAVAIIFLAVFIAVALWVNAIEREHNGAYRVPRAVTRKQQRNRLDLRKALVNRK